MMNSSCPKVHVCGRETSELVHVLHHLTQSKMCAPEGIYWSVWRKSTMNVHEVKQERNIMMLVSTKVTNTRWEEQDEKSEGSVKTCWIIDSVQSGAQVQLIEHVSVQTIVWRNEDSCSSVRERSRIPWPIPGPETHNSLIIMMFLWLNTCPCVGLQVRG